MRRLSRDQRHVVTLTVNGERMSASAEPRTLLSDFLRHELGLTGTHVGCEHGVCGACTVLIDGEPVRSCLTFAVQAEGRSLRTVEGLADGVDALSALQRAFTRHHALQCGFCTAGILISASAFLDAHPRPDERSVREMLSGHLCRCTGYAPIVAAILDEAARREASSDA